MQVNKKVKISDLYDCKVPYLLELFEKNEYPWEILPQIKDHVLKILEGGIEGYKTYQEGVLIGEDVKIYPGVVIEGTAIIGSGTEIRPGAFLRGNVIIGRNCVIGNSTEMKNCVLLDNVQVPHYNYVGDSVLGNFAHMGAGAICSNFKAGGSNVVVHADVDYETNLRKAGGFLADGADVGCGCVINPGTVVGRNTWVYPLTALRGVVGEGMIVKDKNTIIIKNEYIKKDE